MPLPGQTCCKQVNRPPYICCWPMQPMQVEDTRCAALQHGAWCLPVMQLQLPIRRVLLLVRVAAPVRYRSSQAPCARLHLPQGLAAGFAACLVHAQWHQYLAAAPAPGYTLGTRCSASVASQHLQVKLTCPPATDNTHGLLRGMGYVVQPCTRTLRTSYGGCILLLLLAAKAGSSSRCA
jgi:hypothetical protein